jgi:hypothetical protein
MRRLLTTFIATTIMFGGSAIVVVSYATLILYTPAYVSIPITGAVAFGFVWAGMYQRAKKHEEEERGY